MSRILPARGTRDAASAAVRSSEHGLSFALTCQLLSQHLLCGRVVGQTRTKQGVLGGAAA